MFNINTKISSQNMVIVFGSWICVTNGLGGFNNHLADSREPETSAATQPSDLEDFIDDLDEMLLPDLERSRRSPFST